MRWYLSKRHGWLAGQEESREVGFHLVFLLCILLHLRDKNKNKHSAAKSRGQHFGSLIVFDW